MQQITVDIPELAAFVAVANSGSIRAGARVLSRDPTVVSKRLQSLEDRLGVRLMERTTRTLTLTEAGRQYLERVAPLLEELDGANREAAALAHGEPSGRLRVALPLAFGRMWLAPLVVEFLRAYPGVCVEAEYSNRFVDLIGEGFDLAVRLGDLPDSRLTARKIGSRRRLVCAAPSYLDGRPPLLHPLDLEKHSCLSFTGRPDPFRWAFHDHEGRTVTVSVSGPLASDDPDQLLEGALAGFGILYSTDWHVGAALARGELVEILHGWTVVDAGAIYVVTPGGTRPSKSRAFSDFVGRALNPAPWAALTESAIGAD